MKQPPDKKEFQKVIEAAGIREVYMLSSACECRNPFIEPKNIELELKRAHSAPQIKPVAEDKQWLLFCSIEIEVKGVCGKNIKQGQKTTAEKGQTVFKISARYNVVYDITKNPNSLNKGALKYFGEENAFFNVYPYFREFAGSMSQRLNLHPVVLPLLKPASSPSEKEK